MYTKPPGPSKKGPFHRKEYESVKRTKKETGLAKKKKKLKEKYRFFSRKQQEIKEKRREAQFSVYNKIE